MIHLITMHKAKAIALEEGSADNAPIAQGLNHELMKMGFVMSTEAMRVVATQDIATLTTLHADLISAMRDHIGDGGFEPFYDDFPAGVLARGEDKFIQVALEAFWASGEWSPEATAHMQAEYGAEPESLTTLNIMSPEQIPRIFSDLLYANQPLSPFDKECVRYHLARGGDVDFNRISFQETAAFVGALFFDQDIELLPMRHATDVLRAYCAYCGGDEGLKEVTRFKNPSRKQRRVLMRTLEQCDPDSIEESFKIYREPWLRLLYYLHPMTKAHRAAFPKLADFTERLRDNPGSLKTFNSKIEEAIAAHDPEVLQLLKRRPGAFMRRLDHMVRMFGVEAFHEWMSCKPRFAQLVNIYNHFYDRAEAQEGRGAVLASQTKSEVVTYDANAPLSREVVDEITTSTLDALRAHVVPELEGKVYIDPILYLRPLTTNNRASSFSLDAKPVGTVERYEAGETLRLYIHWHTKTDIDLSGFIISSDSSVIKLGWNGQHAVGDYMAYSGDNRGHHEKNAEYIDIDTSKLPEGIEWIVIDARIYSGPESFAGYEGKVRAGWMSRAAPEGATTWLPETIEHSLVLKSESRTAYLMAYHPATRSIVYLDVAMGDAIVSDAEDALKMRRYLGATIALPGADSDDEEITWDKLNVGHLLELLSGELSPSERLADVTFDEHTTSERVSALMQTARRPETRS